MCLTLGPGLSTIHCLSKSKPIADKRNTKNIYKNKKYNYLNIEKLLPILNRI